MSSHQSRETESLQCVRDLPRPLPRGTCQKHGIQEASHIKYLTCKFKMADPIMARHSRSSAPITLCMSSFMTPIDLLRLPSSSNQLVIVPTFRVLALLLFLLSRCLLTCHAPLLFLGLRPTVAQFINPGLV